MCSEEGEEEKEGGEQVGPTNHPGHLGHHHHADAGQGLFHVHVCLHAAVVEAGSKAEGVRLTRKEASGLTN